MSLKSWVLHRVHHIDALFVRSDLPPRDAPHTEPALHRPGPDSMLSNAEHLGAYAALIGAIREELEHFVASHVRLHLAIADHDRFLLTSIAISCPDAPDARRLLQQFQREFKPEQVKRYLAREVIAALPNAAAIDLGQFAGLVDADLQTEAQAAGEYAELLEALRGAEPATTRTYQVSIAGRWTEADPRAAAPAQRGATPATPTTGQRCEFDVEDGDGRRRIVLQAVVPGRRYMVGSSEGCDVRVNGTFTSRRHAEIWLEGDAWWVADAGSTNGIRVEAGAGRVERSDAASVVGVQPLRLENGARIVLSANAQGSASDHPWIALRTRARAPIGATPIAPAAAALRTLVTPIVSARRVNPVDATEPDAAEATLLLTARGAAGVRTLGLRETALPISVGRSRNQHLVIARIHEAVSGHHFDITAFDAAGAVVVVYGDNGVLVDGKTHPSGTAFRWQVGQPMTIGSTPGDDPPCTLTLARKTQD